MWRTIISAGLIFISIFWFPWWISMIFFAVGVVASRYAVVLLIPAFVMDIVYAPHTGTFFHNYLTVLLVAGAVCIKYLILTRTRVEEVYKL